MFIVRVLHENPARFRVGGIAAKTVEIRKQIGYTEAEAERLRRLKAEGEIRMPAARNRQ